MNQITKFTCLSLLIIYANMAQAATIVVDTFDADIGTWGPNTSETTTGHSAVGGNPDGYMTTDNLSSASAFNVIGATNTGANYSGVFADGLWTISVDLSFVNGDFTDSWLRFRYQDSTANGWHISLEDTNFFDSTWQSYSVTFDTNWSDADAIVNGWVKEADGTLTPTPSFSGLWDDVYTSEVRILGGPRMVAGIDNYTASVVPVPAALWLFGSGLIGLIGIARRKKAV